MTTANAFHEAVYQRKESERGAGGRREQRGSKEREERGAASLGWLLGGEKRGQSIFSGVATRGALPSRDTGNGGTLLPPTAFDEEVRDCIRNVGDCHTTAGSETPPTTASPQHGTDASRCKGPPGTRAVEARRPTAVAPRPAPSCSAMLSAMLCHAFAMPCHACWT